MASKEINYFENIVTDGTAPFRFVHSLHRNKSENANVIHISMSNGHSKPVKQIVSANLEDVVDFTGMDLEKQSDYVTINDFWGSTHTEADLYSIDTLYVDIDLHPESRICRKKWLEAIARLCYNN